MSICSECGVSGLFSSESRDCFFFFFFNDTATTEIYTLSLHDALPISRHGCAQAAVGGIREDGRRPAEDFVLGRDRKSTRLNSSHGYISYAVFCLKKKIEHALRTAMDLLDLPLVGFLMTLRALRVAVSL